MDESKFSFASLKPLQRDNEVITAEDDQEFLTRLQLTLNRAASPSRTVC